jgi:hypothetical protein
MQQLLGSQKKIVLTISHILQKNPILEVVVAKSHKDTRVPLNQ